MCAAAEELGTEASVAGLISMLVFAGFSPEWVVGIGILIEFA